jgi:hypothetical protein
MSCCCTKIKTRHLHLYDIFVFSSRIFLVVALNDAVFFSCTIKNWFWPKYGDVLLLPSGLQMEAYSSLQPKRNDIRQQYRDLSRLRFRTDPSNSAVFRRLRILHTISISEKHFTRVKKNQQRAHKRSRPGMANPWHAKIFTIIYYIIYNIIGPII